MCAEGCGNIPPTLPLNLQLFWEWSLDRGCTSSRELRMLGAAVLAPLVSMQEPGAIDFEIKASKSGCIKFLAVDLSARIASDDGFADLAAQCCFLVWWAGGHYSCEVAPSFFPAPSCRCKTLFDTTRRCFVSKSTHVEVGPLTSLTWITSFAPLAAVPRRCRARKTTTAVFAEVVRPAILDKMQKSSMISWASTTLSFSESARSCAIPVDTSPAPLCRRRYTRDGVVAQAVRTGARCTVGQATYSVSFVPSELTES